MTLKNSWLIRNASFLKKNFDAKIFHPNTKWLKSFLVPGPLFRHKLSRLPLRQGSLPKNKPTSGNNFWRRICQWRSKIPGSSETPVSWKKKSSTKIFWKKNHPKLFFRCRKMKRWESSETRFGQVSRRSEPSSRGKRPFKVCRVRCRAGFSSPTRVGDRFDLCRGIPYALRQACSKLYNKKVFFIFHRDRFLGVDSEFAETASKQNFQWQFTVLFLASAFDRGGQTGPPRSNAKIRRRLAPTQIPPSPSDWTVVPRTPE